MKGHKGSACDQYRKEWVIDIELFEEQIRNIGEGIYVCIYTHIHQGGEKYLILLYSKNKVEMI